MAEPHFNYIVTIHNKEKLIRDVLISALLCCGPNSRVYAVLDGCTDNTEKILDEFTDRFEGVPLQKVHTADVHELLSINAGLRAAQQEGYGFNIILQDDVILADFQLEQKLKMLYEWGGGKLGYVSLRLGANFEADALTNGNPNPMKEYVENAYGHGLSDAEILLPGRFAYRTVPIKSPVCLPTQLVREVGFLNEELAPYAHDDPEFAIRAIRAGYFNGVFAMRFYSEIEWGGSRSKPHPNIPKMVVRNMNIIRDRLGPDLERIARNTQRTGVVEFREFCSSSADEAALRYFETAKRQLQTFSLRANARGRLRQAFTFLLGNS